MALEIPANLGDLWLKSQKVPMLAVDQDGQIIWHNQWCTWLYGISLEKLKVTDLPNGHTLAAHISAVRSQAPSPPLPLRTVIRGIEIEVVGYSIGATSQVLLRFHIYRHRPDTILHLHKLIQDFALETGDRVNNPLLTVMNCMQLVLNKLPDGPERHYLELAQREANAMKEFGDWVRRLSEETPVMGHFNLVDTINHCLFRRGGAYEFTVEQNIPPVIGDQENASMVLGGLINLVRQAAGHRKYYITISREDAFVHLDLDCEGSDVKDLRMLSEEMYGGLGLMAARYLLAMMHAHLELDYRSDTGVRVTFITDLTSLPNRA
jgi:nitrogen-specific signal transduction histidine kinase